MVAIFGMLVVVYVLSWFFQETTSLFLSFLVASVVTIGIGWYDCQTAMTCYTTTNLANTLAINMGVLTAAWVMTQFVKKPLRLFMDDNQ